MAEILRGARRLAGGGEARAVEGYQTSLVPTDEIFRFSRNFVFFRGGPGGVPGGPGWSRVAPGWLPGGSGVQNFEKKNNFRFFVLKNF